MLLVNGLLAGSLTFAASRVLWRRNRRNLMYYLDLPVQTIFERQDREGIAVMRQQVDRSYRYATYSLGLSVLGVVVYAPLGLLSVPLTLYSSLPQFERTIENLLDRVELNVDFIQVALVGVALVLERYFLASFLQWVFVLNEKASFELSEYMERYVNANTNRVDWAAFFEHLRSRVYMRGDMITLDSSFVGASTRTDAAPQAD